MSATIAPPPMRLPLAACYVAASLLLWATQGLGMNFVSANTTQLQGGLGATLTETNWLVAAYMAPNVSLTLLLTKIRTQFGLRRFAEITICVFVVASLLQLGVHDLASGVATRFVAGVAAAPMSTLAFLYMMEAFPPEKKLSWGLSMALTCSGATAPLARLVSPVLLDLGEWQALYTMEIGLALASLAVVWRLRLTPVPRMQVLHRLDFISYPLIATAFGLFAVVLSLGRLYWWFEAPWIGWCTAIAIICLALASAIELNRTTPLMNLHWLLGPEMLHFAAVLILFRVVLAEQTSGAIGLFQAVGLLNEQSAPLYAAILAASFLGGLACGATLKAERTPALHAAALLCICIGAALDSQATNLTRPADMYLSQALISFGGALFLPPSLVVGLTAAMKRGTEYITSFLVVFLFTQSLGGLVGSAVFGTFVIIREKAHSAALVQHVVLTDPLVAERVRILAGAYGRVLTDGQLLNAEGLALLGQQATLEANILAYNDAFLAIAIISGAALAGLLVHLLAVRLRRALTPATI